MKKVSWFLFFSPHTFKSRFLAVACLPLEIIKKQNKTKQNKTKKQLVSS